MRTKIIFSVTMMLALQLQRLVKRDEVTLSSEETKPVEQANINLHFSESIVVSQSVSQ